MYTISMYFYESFMHIIYTNQIQPSFPLLQFFPIALLFLAPNFVCFFLKHSLSSLIAVCMYMNLRLSNRAWVASQGLHPWGKSIFPPPKAYSCCLAMDGTSWPHPLSVLGVLLVWSCTHSHSPCELICAMPVISNKHCFAADVHYFWLLPFFSALFPWWALSLGIGQRIYYVVLIYNWAFHSLIFSASWPVMSLLFNHHLLPKEASLRKNQRQTIVWVKEEFNIISIYQDHSIIFSMWHMT